MYSIVIVAWYYHICRVSNPKNESIQNQSFAVFPSTSTIGKIETIPQTGVADKKFVPNAINGRG